MKDEFIKVEEALSNAIQHIEAVRDLERELDENETQLYNVLNFSFDLLARCNYNLQETFTIEEDDEGDRYNRMCISSNELADKVFVELNR